MVNIKQLVCNIRKIKQDFEEIKPNLEEHILNNTAIVAYHRPPIKEEDKDIENLVGLIFPPEDLNKKAGNKTPKLSNRLAMFDVYVPGKADVYIGVDVIIEKPEEVLLYSLQHLDKAPRKIMKDSIGGFYLTTKPLLSGGNWMHPEVDIYILNTKLAVALHGIRYS